MNTNEPFIRTRNGVYQREVNLNKTIASPESPSNVIPANIKQTIKYWNLADQENKSDWNGLNVNKHL